MAKRKRSVIRLYNAMMEPLPKDIRLSDDSPRNEIKKELKQYGSMVVDLVLSQLYALRKKEGILPVREDLFRFYYLLTVIDDLAQPRHAASVAAMLAWPEITINQMITLAPLLNTVKKFDIRHILPHLNALKQIRNETCWGHPNDPFSDTALCARLEEVIKKCLANKPD